MPVVLNGGHCAFLVAKCALCVFILVRAHAGLELKSALIEHLSAQGHKVKDHGPYEYDAFEMIIQDFCIPAAEAVVKDSGSLGIVIGGSGNGEQIAANKVKGIRAALAWNIETAKLAKRHNNANVISSRWPHAFNR
jgi:ribose 5-phosphate isomerase B